MTKEEIIAKANTILEKALGMNENEVALKCLHFIYLVQSDHHEPGSESR